MLTYPAMRYNYDIGSTSQYRTINDDVEGAAVMG